jgi:hypothetical protein
LVKVLQPTRPIKPVARIDSFLRTLCLSFCRSVQGGMGTGAARFACRWAVGKGIGIGPRRT